MNGDRDGYEEALGEFDTASAVIEAYEAGEAVAYLVDEETGETEELEVNADTYAEALEVPEPDPHDYGTWMPGIPALLDMVLCDEEGEPRIADWLYGLVMDGVVAGVGAVLGFVPQMLVLFLLGYRIHGPRGLRHGPDFPAVRPLRQVLHPHAGGYGLRHSRPDGLPHH